jgi:hypothetical protein
MNYRLKITSYSFVSFINLWSELGVTLLLALSKEPYLSGSYPLNMWTVNQKDGNKTKQNIYNELISSRIAIANQYRNQGCQIVCFQTKNPNFGKIWRALERTMLLYFMTIWSILRSFGIIFGLWYSLLSFGIFFFVLACLDQEKSGNPDRNCLFIVQFFRSRKLFSLSVETRLYQMPRSCGWRNFKAVKVGLLWCL